jgi:hypothetical protein
MYGDFDEDDDAVGWEEKESCNQHRQVIADARELALKAVADRVCMPRQVLLWRYAALILQGMYAFQKPKDEKTRRLSPDGTPWPSRLPIKLAKPGTKLVSPIREEVTNGGEETPKG